MLQGDSKHLQNWKLASIAITAQTKVFKKFITNIFQMKKKSGKFVVKNKNDNSTRELTNSPVPVRERVEV
jgi:hypothetical protein